MYPGPTKYFSKSFEDTLPYIFSLFLSAFPQLQHYLRVNHLCWENIFVSKRCNLIVLFTMYLMVPGNLVFLRLGKSILCCVVPSSTFCLEVRIHSLFSEIWYIESVYGWDVGTVFMYSNTSASKPVIALLQCSVRYYDFAVNHVHVYVIGLYVCKCKCHF